MGMHACFLIMNRRSRQKKKLSFRDCQCSSIQLNQDTPNPVGAGASAQRARHQKLACASASSVDAVMLEPGRHGRNPSAQNTFSTDCTGFCSWMLTCRVWEKTEVFTDLSVVMGNTGKAMWRHGQE